MGGVNYNAYTGLLALGPARNTVRSTRIGPTAFRGQQVYTLGTPARIQDADNTQANYVPLSMATLVTTPTSFMNFTSWQAGLQTMASNQGLVWTTLVANYEALLQGAFDRQTVNDTRYYRANCYDNIFVRGGAVNASGTIDVFSELGSWPQGAAALPNPQPALAPNPWVAAAAGLNALAQAELGAFGAVLSYTYGNPAITYNITAPLPNACEAAVFLTERIANHLPVYVEVQL
jgi:hypothetical protein